MVSERSVSSLKFGDRQSTESIENNSRPKVISGHGKQMAKKRKIDLFAGYIMGRINGCNFSTVWLLGAMLEEDRKK